MADADILVVGAGISGLSFEARMNGATALISMTSSSSGVGTSAKVMRQVFIVRRSTCCRS